MSTRRRSVRLEPLPRSYQTRSKTSAAASVLHGSTKRAPEQSSHQRPKRAVRNINHPQTLTPNPNSKLQGDHPQTLTPIPDSKLQGDHPQTLTPNSKECVGESSPNSHPRGDENYNLPRKGTTKLELERKFSMIRQKYFWNYHQHIYTTPADEEDDLEVIPEEDDLEASKENVEKDKQGDEVMDEGQQPNSMPEEEDDGLGTSTENVEKDNQGEKVPDEGQQIESVAEEHSGTADT